MFDLKDLKKAADIFGTPLYVYSEEKIINQARALKKGLSYSPKKILYAVKANSNPQILKLLKKEGIGVDAVSPGEISLALKAGFLPKDILFTANNISDEEMDFSVKNKVLLNADSLSRLEKFGRKYRGRKICVRVNPDVGAGHHDHCITGGPKSKFGIWYSEVPKIKRIAEKYELKIIGVHEHIGSQILEPEKFLMAMDVLLRVANNFPDLEFIDFGGGFGVPYKPEDKPLNMADLGKKISAKFSEFCNEYGRKLTLVVEPGRYLVAESGYLIARVTTVKRNPSGRVFVGVDSGFNHLVRPAMYGSYHEIVNISNLKGLPAQAGAKEKVDVVGNLCESGDKFAEERLIGKAKESDLLAIKTAGAYGYSMSSNYNLRPKPAEILVLRDGRFKPIRKREDINDPLFFN